MRCHQVMRPNEGGVGGRRKEREREGGSTVHCRSTVGSRNRLVAREMREVVERASGCIGFRGAGNSGPEAGSDRVNVHNRGPEGEWTHDEGRGGRRA
jgi:hypothetical protein